MTAGQSRPPFASGNKLAVRHGAKSRPMMDELAAAKLVELRESAPWIEDVDQDALLAWLVAEARCDVLRRHTDAHGLLDEAGKPRVIRIAAMVSSTSSSSAGARAASSRLIEPCSHPAWRPGRRSVTAALEPTG